MQSRSKYIRIRLLLSLLLCSLGTAAATRDAQAQAANCNLAPNPAFEQGTSTSITGWNLFVNSGAGTFSVSTYPSPVQSGATAAQVVVTQPGDVNFLTTEPGNILVQPSTTYRMSARVKSSLGKQACLRIIEWTSQGTVVADTILTCNAGTGDWETVEATLTTHANTAFVSLRLVHTVSSGTFIWDDVMFARDDTQRCVDVRSYVTQATPGFKMCVVSNPSPASPTACNAGFKSAGKEFLREQYVWDGSTFTPTVYDYTSHTLASRAMIGVQKTWNNLDGWRCFANRDEACGAARVSPGQNVQYTAFGLQQSLTLPILTLSTIPNTTRTPGAAQIHDWQRVAVRGFNPSTAESTSLIGDVWDRTWAYVLASYNFGGSLGVQSNVLVYESEAIGDTVSPYGFGGGSRLERYMFVRGFGMVYQEGEKNPACTATQNAANCTGTYTQPDPGVSPFPYRVNAGSPPQDPLDPNGTGFGTFNAVDWW